MNFAPAGGGRPSPFPPYALSVRKRGVNLVRTHTFALLLLGVFRHGAHGKF